MRIPPRLNLAGALVELKQYARAEPVLQEIVRGERRASPEEMREVVRLAPERAEGHLFLARGLLHEQAPLDEVQSHVEKGLSVARTAGRPDKANEVLSRASAHTPAALNRESPHVTRMD